MNKTFESITIEKLTEILGITIKRDEINKLITFLTMLSAYTDSCQLNLSFNAPSSSGKSFLPMEIAALFPSADVNKFAYCSPTAFFHQTGTPNKETSGYIVDLSRKILIFLDQPHDMLLQHLRPMLSHDEKEIHIKITDKSQKMGLRTKNITLIGFPVVIFCTAGLRIDEQEATRFILLSPEITQEKLREAIEERLRKEADITAYRGLVESNPDRVALKERILAIKEKHIQDIRVGSYALLREMFAQRVKVLKPRHQRDIGKIIDLTKILALLNFLHRQEIEGAIYANDDDVKQAFHIWDSIAESQELNLPPYIYNLYKEVIVPAFEEKKKGISDDLGIKIGLTRQDILSKHFAVYGRFLPEIQLRQQILPMLKTSGLIIEEPDDIDKRRLIIYPTTAYTISQPENNSVVEGGVDEKKVEMPIDLQNIDKTSPWAQYIPQISLEQYSNSQLEQAFAMFEQYKDQMTELLGSEEAYESLKRKLLDERDIRSGM